ncbi:DUF2059 domain-containing protein [Aurantibacter aestuarii]|uniref:DUF2059 domain-containing protein n=1 Tax=Aurantibacter aestuarii TaxID=1266046 RepID=A0A2T1NCU8_9FLAO|nr:DUF2059 domain-containing protein [Aurantibacter aestuarii]PSG90237.1 DUF2059 domain-containing protein [Aurantibacter aestuarii]
MNKIIYVLAIALATSLSTFAQSENSDFKNQTIEFIKITGSRDLFDGAIEQIGASVPEENKAAYRKEANATLDQLYSDLADIYMEEFTAQEINELVKFYKSDLGKKVASKQGLLAQKGMMLGQNWGMGLGKIAEKHSK